MAKKVTDIHPHTKTSNSKLPMKYFHSLIPFIAGWALLLLTDTFAVIGLINAPYGADRKYMESLALTSYIWNVRKQHRFPISYPPLITINRPAFAFSMIFSLYLTTHKLNPQETIPMSI